MRFSNVFLGIKCFLISLKSPFKYGVYVRHIYRTYSGKPTIIAYTDNSFREIDSYVREQNEKVCMDAVLLKDKCIYCGKETEMWCSKQFFDEYLTDNYIIEE